MNTARPRKEKPAYSSVQNIAFMISLAWRERRSVIVFVPAMAAAAILLSLTQLFVVPSILEAVGANVSIAELSAIILFFTCALILLNASSSYLAAYAQFGRIEIRLGIGAMIQNKALTMSYPDIEDPHVRRKMDKASMLVTSGSAATDAVWTTLMDLLQNTVEFVIFLSPLTTLDLLMITAVCATTIVSFWVSDALNGWGYRHRDEESDYSRRMNHLSEKSRDHTLAKDVRIFEMRDWIEDVYNSMLRLYQSFAARRERIYIYIWGIGKILSDLALLQRQSLDLCVVRGFWDHIIPVQMHLKRLFSPASSEQIRGITSTTVIRSKHFQRHGFSKPPRSADADVFLLRVDQLVRTCDQIRLVDIDFGADEFPEAFVSRI